MFVKHGHFVICINKIPILSMHCLVWIDVASVKHYLNAIKAKQGALNARKLLIGCRQPTSAFGHSGSSFGPSNLAPIGIRLLLLNNLTTAQTVRAVHSSPRE